MTALHAVSLLVLVLVGSGVALRRRRRVHYTLMITAFLVDLGLVLWIEATRGAVERVVGKPNPALLYFHVAVSVAALALYVGQFALGWQGVRGRPVRVGLHRRLGVAFVCCRLANFITSFAVSPAPEAPAYAVHEVAATPAAR